MTGTHRCFYCRTRINPAVPHYLHAYIRHLYKNGRMRYSDPVFHAACFEKFKVRGRPRNHETEYEVIDSETIRGKQPASPPLPPKANRASAAPPSPSPQPAAVPVAAPALWFASLSSWRSRRRRAGKPGSMAVFDNILSVFDK